MKRKTRFNDGGMNNPFQGDDIDPFSAVRDASGSTDPRQEGPSSEALFDETSGRELSLRRNLDTGEYYFTEPPAPKAAARAMPKAPAIKDVPGSGRGTMAGRRAIDDIMRDAGGGGRGRSMGRTAADVDTFTPGRGVGRAEIPVDTTMSGPAKQFSSAMEMSDTGRNIATTAGALGGAGRAITGAPRVMAAAQTAKEMGKGMAAPAARAAKEGLEVAAKSGPKAGLETAKSTLSGMKSRAEMQAKRATREKAENAAALEKAKPILQSRKDTKPARAARTRRTEEDMGIEFSKGGMASRRADGCAMRGKTRGKIY